MYEVNPNIKKTNFEDEGLGLLALSAAHEIEALMILLMKEIEGNLGADVEWIGITSLAKRVQKLNSVVAASICEIPMPDSLRKELESVVG